MCSDLSLFTLQCIDYSGHRKSHSSPASSTHSKASSQFSAASALTFASDTTEFSPYFLSDWERITYYLGISPNHPELLYRSDLLENPFPTPKGRNPYTPTKTVYGVFNTPLNTVWDTVAPQIRDIVKSWKIRYSAIKAARFVTHGEDGTDTLGPIVIWIATYPTTTTAETAHDASPEILALLKGNGVEGAVVEWYEGVVEKLSGPPLLRVTNNTNPTYHVRRFLTAALGMPIATLVAIAEREYNVEGSVTMFFHENRDKHGAPSANVFGVSNCHVLRGDTTVEYEFKGAGAPPQQIRIAGLHRFQSGLDDIKACVGGYGIDADLLTREIVDLEARPKSEDPEEVAEDEAAVKAKQEKLAKVKKDIDILETFYKDIISQWGDSTSRNIGHVDWAPEISVDVQGHKYTKDIGTFKVDAARFKAHFKGNVVDLGEFYLIFLITLFNKNIFQDLSSPPNSLPICSTLKVAVGRPSNSPQIGSSGSMAVSRASSWLLLIALTEMVSRAFLL